MELKYKILLTLAVTAGIYIVSFKDYSKCLEKSDALYNCNDLTIFPDFQSKLSCLKVATKVESSIKISAMYNQAISTANKDSKWKVLIKTTDFIKRFKNIPFEWNTYSQEIYELAQTNDLYYKNVFLKTYGQCI